MNVKELRQLDIMLAIKDLLTIASRLDKVEGGDKEVIRKHLLMGVSYLSAIFMIYFGEKALEAYPETVAKINELIASGEAPYVVFHHNNPLREFVSTLRWAIAQYNVCLAMNGATNIQEILAVADYVADFYNCVQMEA